MRSLEDNEAVVLDEVNGAVSANSEESNCNLEGTQDALVLSSAIFMMKNQSKKQQRSQQQRQDDGDGDFQLSQERSDTGKEKKADMQDDVTEEISPVEKQSDVVVEELELTVQV